VEFERWAIDGIEQVKIDSIMNLSGLEKLFVHIFFSGFER